MATSYLSPGVYVEEVDRGSKPIEAVGTNTVGFLGESMMGPNNQAVLVTNWSQYVKTFGDFTQSTHLAHAIYGFFNNGGSRCFVVNVGAPASLEIGDAAPTGATPAPAADGKKDDKAAAAAAPKKAPDRDALYIGKDNGPGQRSGLKCFDEIDEISLVAAPGCISPAVQDALLSHCEQRKDRFAILDSPEAINGGVDKLSRPRDSKYGAYYFPWIQVYDPERGNVFVPPSGHVLGVYARTDSERGVHKAPANEITQVLSGAKKVAVIQRGFSYGHGGHLAIETKAAMYDAGLRAPVFEFVSGLGGTDIPMKLYHDISDYVYEHAQPEETVLWMGVPAK